MHYNSNNMNNKFKSEKSYSLGILLTSVSLLILFLSFGLPLFSKQSISLVELLIKIVLSILIIGLFVWCWIRTYYIVDKTKLTAICGPTKFDVRIQDIKVIKTNQKTINGIIKPTLSWKCIVIEYGGFKSISVSPENQETFINILTEINKDIFINYYA